MATKNSFGCRSIAALATLALVIAHSRAEAQSAQFEFSAGPAIRDVRHTATDRWGARAQLGFVTPSTRGVALHVAVSASGFEGPGDTPTSTSRSESEQGSVGGFGAWAGTAQLRWAECKGAQSAFIEVGGGAARLIPGGEHASWHRLLTAGGGYQYSLTPRRSVFITAQYERIIGMASSPRWVTPFLVGFLWSVGS